MPFSALMLPLTALEQTSLLGEIWTYIVKHYFSIDWYSYNYQYLAIDDSGLISISTGIAAFMLGIIIASAIMMFQKRTLGDLVRAIDRERCLTPETAMTLTQLGMIRNTAIKNDLRHGRALRRVVRCVGEEEYRAALQAQKDELIALAEQGNADAVAKLKKWRDLPYRLDFETDRFYIPEKLIYGADVHFDKKGTTPLSFMLVVVLCIIMLALICFFLPELLQMLDNFIGALVK